MIRSICASVSGMVRDVSTTKSARRRFSASGIWRATDLLELLGRHARPVQHTLALDLRRRADDDRHVDARLAASRTAAEFPGPPSPLLAPPRRAGIPLGRVHQRMHDRLQPLEAPPDRRAAPPPEPGDRHRRSAASQGTPPRSAPPRLRPPYRACAPSASASQTPTPSVAEPCAAVDLPMPIEPVRPMISINVPRCRRRGSARSSRVTSGRTPNQRSNPGTAWCSSMPSPSTVRSPRARARARNGVSSGT